MLGWLAVVVLAAVGTSEAAKCESFVLVFCALACARATLTLTAAVRGVAPEDAGKYAAGATFSCFDGTKRIPFDRVNDDYCDCPDGSDEPGTSACSSGSFFCANRGHESKRIHSAQVDDGVCDCCDGSDEASLPCSNNCREVGEKMRLERARQAEEVRAALGVRQTYLDKARAELPAKRTRREELQGLMATEDAVLEAVNLKKLGRCHCCSHVSVVNFFQIFLFVSLLPAFKASWLWG
jgi:hypothetical protein